ncbi:MAG: ABC transporter substrate-binding protein [Candidatus Electrothrix sp. ATG1]|nr:ABC transporter substrate-binding protein [Candidatus Electrothrix sp. ATG1]
MEKYNEPPQVSYFLSGYDAANLLFHAIEQTAIIHTDGTLHIGRQALRDTLYSVKSFSGVNGELSCNRFGDCHPPCFNILRLDNPALGLNGLESNILFTYPPDK